MGKSKFQALKEHKKALSPQERKQVMDKGAVWHHGPNGEATPAVWKSESPAKGTTFVTNTHRAFATAPTLKGAISKYHKVIKGTA